jgi:hypothetical protein
MPAAGKSGASPEAVGPHDKTDDKKEKKRRPLIPRDLACIKAYKAERKANKKTSMEATVEALAQENGWCAASIIRRLNDHPTVWK